MLVMTDKIQWQNVKHFSHWGNRVTKNARRTRGINSTSSVAKATFKKLKDLSTSKLGSILRKNTGKMLSLVHRIYGAENWTLHKVDQKYLESYKMWFWRRVEEIIWKDRVVNEEVCHRVKEERNLLTYLLTYLLTPCNKVLLKKPTGSAASQEILRILWNLKVHYRTHSARHLSLS
jgi:hypothetical protein